MRAVSLFVQGFLALAVHFDARSDEDVQPISCRGACTISVTVVDDPNLPGPGHCKPTVAIEVDVKPLTAGGKTVITWELTDPGFRFHKGKEGEERGVDVLNADGSNDDRKHPHHRHGGPARNNQQYTWTVLPPNGAEERNDYKVKVIRRHTGDKCEKVDPVIVNRDF